MATILPTTPAPTPAPALQPLLPGFTSQTASDQQRSDMAKYFPNGVTPAAGSTLSALSALPNSDKTSTASSATILNTQAGQNALNGAASAAPVVTPKVTQADFYNAVNSYTGTTIDNNIIQQGLSAGLSEDEATQEMNSVVQANIAKNTANTQHQQDLADQQASDLADTAENDAELAAAKAQVDQQFASLGQKEINNAANAGYGVSAVGTNQTGATAF